MSYGVHKLTPVHGTMCEKFDESWGPQKKCFGHMDGRMDGRYYQVLPATVGTKKSTS